MKEPQPSTANSELKPIHQQIVSGLLDRDSSHSLMFLSDFDNTLCHDYGFDDKTNNRIPIVSPSLVVAAQQHKLIIATARRANNPTTPLFWSSGLVTSGVPLVAENGGVLITEEQGKLHYETLIDDDIAEGLHTTHLQAARVAETLPHDRELVIKQGLTMLVLRTQTPNKEVINEEQHELAKQLQQVVKYPGLVVVDNGGSVTIQHESVNKGVGFSAALTRLGLRRDELYVVGMGDAPNDEHIFSNADLSIGFNQVVRSMVDRCIEPKKISAAAIFQATHSALSEKSYSL